MATTIAVAVIKVAIVAGGLMLIKWIAGKLGEKLRTMICRAEAGAYTCKMGRKKPGCHNAAWLSLFLATILRGNAKNH